MITIKWTPEELEEHGVDIEAVMVILRHLERAQNKLRQHGLNVYLSPGSLGVHLALIMEILEQTHGYNPHNVQWSERGQARANAAGILLDRLSEQVPEESRGILDED